MVSCPRCGAEVKTGDKFCPYCGTLLAVSGQPYREREVCFEVERRRDYSGLVSFGIFLLIVGTVFIVNPNLISEFRFWVRQSVNEKTLVRPPQGLIVAATVFFGLTGLSNFFVAGIRLFTYRARTGVLSDALSGVALLSFSYLIYLYGAYTVTWQVVLALEAMVCGLLIILYSMTRYLFL